MGSGVWGWEFGVRVGVGVGAEVWGLRFEVWGFGSGIWGLVFGIWGLGLGVWGLMLGFEVQGIVLGNDMGVFDLGRNEGLMAAAN